MPSLGRRKQPQQSVALGSVLDLPDDILILICAQCRIDELFALRLTSAKTRNIIDEYITTIAPSVARSTFPHSDHLLERYVNILPTLAFRFLKDLIPEQLAAILVDRHRVADEWLQSRYGIPAEDGFGDALRDRVAGGWRILGQLSNISRTEHALAAKQTSKTPTDLANKLFRPAHFKLEALKHVEDVILQKRLAHIARLSHEEAQDYKLLLTLLSSAFSTSISNIGDAFEPWPFDFGSGIDGQRALRKGKTWLSWYILGEGPHLFWHQWWSLPHDDPRTRNYIRDRAIEAFHNTPEKLSNHQRSLARTLQEAVNDKAAMDFDFTEWSPVRHFARYAKHRLQRREAGLPPAREILGHVPFLINFRCPVEIVSRYEALEEERNASRASQPLPR
jgi:hypothetical protein